MALFCSREIGSLAHVSAAAIGIGGAESNVAIGLSRLGVRVSWVGRVGADSLGERVLRELRAEGVLVRGILDPDAATGLMIKENRTRDSSRVTYYRRDSAGSRLHPNDLSGVDIEGADLLHVTGITPALSTTARDTVFAALDRAKAAGVPISFDVNHRPSLWGDRSPVADYRAIAKAATLVLAGEDEARLIVGDTATPLAAAIAELGPTHAIVKRGANGAAARIDGVDYVQDAIQIVPVDTVGAGDAFVAGYLAEYLTGAPAQTRLLTAVTAGAFVCLTPGDWEGFPSRADFGLLTATEPVTR